MRKNQIAYHSYAYDTHIYLALSPNDYSPIDSLCQCIDEINSWMCQNFLQLNKEKTEVIAFGNKDEVLKVNAYLDSRGQTTKNQVKNLGVILESDLSFSSHSIQFNSIFIYIAHLKTTMVDQSASQCPEKLPHKQNEYSKTSQCLNSTQNKSQGKQVCLKKWFKNSNTLSSSYVHR